MTEDEFKKLRAYSEKKRVEFKGKVHFKNFKEHFAITLISMANIIGGGIIVLGVGDDPPHEVEGLPDEELKNFNKKDITDHLKNKVSPIPDFELEIFSTEGKNILIFYVQEFKDVPHIITNQIEYNGKKYLPGDILVRSDSSESRKIYNENEMRELLSLALRKRGELLLGEINSIITGKVRKTEEDPELLFHKSVRDFDESAEQFKNSNKDLVYWKMQIVPIPLESRITDLTKNLEKSLCSVKDYSFPAFYGFSNDIQIIHDSLILNSKLEYWRYSKELCFGMYKGLWSEQEPKSSYFNYDPPPQRAVPYNQLISDLFEFFTFCKNMLSDQIIESVWINVELCNTKDRYIGSFHDLHFRRHFNSQRCLTESIKINPGVISMGELKGSFKDIAADYALSIFRNFQHVNITVQMIQDMYEKSLKN